MKSIILSFVGYYLCILPLYGCQTGATAGEGADTIAPDGLALDSAIHDKSPAKPLVNQELSWEITTDLLLGKTGLQGNKLFRLIDKRYSTKAIYLLGPVADQFEAMCQAALKDGITLRALSGTRTYEQQRVIWERKWNDQPAQRPAAERARHILRYSSMPMTSRHHWGTDIDINTLNNNYFETAQGRKEYDWLMANAHKFGFVQVYGDKQNGRKGYEMERWHWSYMPIAARYLEAYNKHITLQTIKGFTGSESARELNVIQDYVNGIDTVSVNTFRQVKTKQSK